MPIEITKKNTSPKVEILKAGKFKRRFEDDLEISLADMRKMKKHFYGDVRRLKLNDKPALPFNFSHDTWAEASGWIVNLDVGKNEEDIDALFAEVEWTPKGAQKIRDKEFQFVSSEFAYDYRDAETGKKYDIVLGGAALTNIPFIRGMAAVHLSEGESGQRTIVSLKLSGDPDDNLNAGTNVNLSEEFKKLSPEDQEKFLAECGLMEEDKQLSENLEKTQKDLQLSEKKREQLEVDLSKAGGEKTSMELQLDEQGKQIKSLIKSMAEKEQAAEFDAMLSEGKVCEAQREAFMKGDVKELLAKAQPVKLSEFGAGDQGGEGGDATTQVMRLAKEKMEKTEGLSLADTVSNVLYENPNLKRQYEQEA